MTETLTAPDARSFEDAVAMGMHLLAHADDVKWAMGDLLVALINSTEPEPENARESQSRVNGVIKQFAEAIKAVSRNTLKGYYEVAKFWPKDLRSGFATLSWSHFREGYRSGKPLALAHEQLSIADANDWPVGTLRRALAGGDAATTVTVKRVYDVRLVDFEIINTTGITRIAMHSALMPELNEHRKQPGFTCKLTVSWQETRETVTA